MAKHNNSKAIFQKWWFCLLIVVILLIISISSTIIILGNKKNNEIDNISKEIKNIYGEATLYTSYYEKAIYIELNNYDTNQNSQQLTNILTTIKEKIKNSEFSQYDKLITLAFINSSNKEEGLIIRTVYNLPDLKIEEAKEYIDFDEYSNLFEKYNNAMDGYTRLYNSIR